MPGTTRWTPASRAARTTRAQNASTTFTISPAAPAFSNLTASQSIVYGTESVTLSGTLTAGSLVPPGSVTVSAGSASATATIGSGGSFTATLPVSALAASSTAYTITYSYQDTTDSNFQGTTNSATTLTVNKAVLTVTASAESKTYGQTLTFGSGSTLFTSSGLQNGETIGSVTLAVSNNGGAATAPVGTYTITASAATGGNFTASNYNITYDTATLTVTTVSGSIYVLDPAANGAVNISGNARVNAPGEVVVDSSSASAVLASGNASLKATDGLYVEGSVSKSGNASVQTASHAALWAIRWPVSPCRSCPPEPRTTPRSPRTWAATPRPRSARAPTARSMSPATRA